MRQPPDEFGRYLRSLRRSRRLSADRLSVKVGRKKTYIGDWERKPNLRPNPEVLLRVADELELSDPERRKLLRLADERNPVRAVALSNPFAVEADANLLHALLQVEGFDWPGKPREPSPENEPESELVEAIGWVLARYAATTGVIPLADIGWPPALVKLGVFPPIDKKRFPTGEPEELGLPYEAFIEGSTDRLSPEAVLHQSIVVANAYRHLLFDNLDRTHAIVNELQHWSCRYDGLSTRLSLKFRRTDHQELWGFDDVDLGVVSEASERSLAFYLWIWWRWKKKSKRTAQWFCEIAQSDWLALSTVGRAHPDSLRTYQQRRVLRDALFAMEIGYWPVALTIIREAHGIAEGSEPELEKELSAVPLSDAARLRILSEPWRLAAVNPEVIVQYLKSMNALPLVQAESAESTETEKPKATRRPAKRKKVKSPQRKRKRKK
jgi:transcriptional regulator with XRE-family HTH domain